MEEQCLILLYFWKDCVILKWLWWPVLIFFLKKTGFTNKTWKVFKLSPLYKFSSSPRDLKRYGQLLSSSVAMVRIFFFTSSEAAWNEGSSELFWVNFMQCLSGINFHILLKNHRINLNYMYTCLQAFLEKRLNFFLMKGHTPSQGQIMKK